VLNGSTLPSHDQLRLLTRVRSKVGLYLQLHFEWLGGEQPNLEYSHCTELLKKLGGKEVSHAKFDGLFIGHDVKNWNTLSLWLFPDTQAVLALIRSREFLKLSAQAKNIVALVVVPNARSSHRWLQLGSRLLPRFLTTSKTHLLPGSWGLGGIHPSAVQLKNFQQCTQTEPVLMLDALKFKKFSEYGASRQSISGQKLYRERYGRPALTCLHEVGGQLVLHGQYQFTLIGAHGNPRLGQWDEILIAQYPSRDSFFKMLQLEAYQLALVHRQAALEKTCVWCSTPLKKSIEI